MNIIKAVKLERKWLVLWKLHNIKKKNLVVSFAVTTWTFAEPEGKQWLKKIVSIGDEKLYIRGIEEK